MARSSGATPSLISHSLAIGGPNPWVDPVAYGARFDGKISITATTASGTPNITVPITGDFLGFTAADVGKRLVAIQIGVLDAIVGGKTETAVFAGTISSVTNSSTVVVSGNASATCSGNAKVFWGTDDTVAIQAAISALQSSSSSPTGGEIRCPRGIAMISAVLDMSDRHGMTLTGRGFGGVDAPAYYWRGTTFVATTAGQSMLKISGDGVHIEGIALDGAGKTASIGIDQTGDSLHYADIRNVWVNGCVTGYSGTKEQYGNDFYNLVVTRCTDGLNFAPVATGIQKVDFWGCSFEQNSGIGILLSAGTGNTQEVNFMGGTSQINAYGMRLAGGVLGGVTGIHTYGMHFEGNGIRAIDIVKGPADYGAVSCSFNGLRFYGGPAGFTGGVAASDGAWMVSFNRAYIDNFRAGSTLWNFTGALANTYGNVVSIDTRYQDNHGATVFAASGNKGLSNGYGHLTALTSNADIAITTGGAGQTLAFNTISHDPNQMAISNTQVQIQLDGTYTIELSVRFAADAGGTYRQVAIFVNGTAIRIKQEVPTAAAPTDIALSATTTLSAGDLVTVWVAHDKGSNLSVLHSTFGPHLTVQRVP
jgi:hypothetical protein